MRIDINSTLFEYNDIIFKLIAFYTYIYNDLLKNNDKNHNDVQICFSSMYWWNPDYTIRTRSDYIIRNALREFWKKIGRARKDIGCEK